MARCIEAQSYQLHICNPTAIQENFSYDLPADNIHSLSRSAFVTLLMPHKGEQMDPKMDPENG